MGYNLIASFMGKALIIAEKPRWPRYRKALGGFTRHDHFFENEKYIVSSAVGICWSCVCRELRAKRGKWSFASLR